MTFLNPLVLFGLAAAALPVIIHLLNLRRLRTVEFSSLQFLRELQKTKMRRLRIRQLLLLILRVLVIALLVFAFSRPALQVSSSGFAGGTATTTMVVLIDDSPSMAVRNDLGVLFTQAKERAASLLDLARQGDQLYVLPLSSLRHQTPPMAFSSPSAAREMLGKLEVSDESFPLRRALPIAEHLLAASPNVNHELYLLTDAQASQFAGGSDKDSAAPDARTRVFLVTLPSHEPPNVGIVSAEVKTRIVTVNKPVELEATVANFGPVEARDQVLSVYLDGERTVQQSVTITPHGAAVSDLTLIPKRRGPLHGYVQIEDDALEIDNKRFFVLDVPDHVRILLAGPATEDTKYPFLALTLQGDSTLAGLYTVRRISEEQLASTDFGRFDVIVLCNIKEFSPVEAARLAQFVTSGGGALLFPGPWSDAGNYNHTLLAALGVPPLGRDTLGAAHSRRPGAGASFLTFDKVDYAHPLFAGLFEPSFRNSNAKPSIESPRIAEAWGLQTGSQGHAIITLSNGRPFLTEFTPGSGRLLVAAVDAGTADSDFPLKGVYAPLVHRAALYLASEREVGRTFVAGEHLRCRVKLRSSAEQRAYVLTSPSGVDVRITPNILSSNGAAEFTSSSSSEVGIYDLHEAGTGKAENRSASGPLLAGIAVNVDTAESDLRVASPEEIRSVLERSGLDPSRLRELPPRGAIEDIVRQTRYGVELWRHFLLAALLLALTEMIVARGMRREDRGEPAP